MLTEHKACCNGSMGLVNSSWEHRELEDKELKVNLA